MNELQQNIMIKTSNDTHDRTNYTEKKVPDFISRLKGFINVPSINFESDNVCITKVRRAIILAKSSKKAMLSIFFKKRKPQMLMQM